MSTRTSTGIGSGISGTLVALLLGGLLLSQLLPSHEVPGVGSVQVWDHYEKHVQEYGSDFVSYFFGQGPREQRDCEELVIQWYQIPGAGGLYGVALFGAQSHLLVTAIPMRRTELLRLLEKSGCPKGHVGHDSMGGSGFAY